MFVYGDVQSYAQNWEVLTLKNCYSIEPPSYASTAYVVASFGLVSFLLFRKNLGNLREFFGQIVYRPPLAKNCPYAYAPENTQTSPVAIFLYSCASSSFKTQLLRYCEKRSFLGVAKSWKATLDRVPWFGRHVENLGDVIIYPVLVVARTDYYYYFFKTNY